MRLTLEEDYPGEAKAKGAELLKSLARKLGGTVREQHAPHEDGQSTFRALREHSADMGQRAERQIARMIDDVARYLENRG